MNWSEHLLPKTFRELRTRALVVYKKINQQTGGVLTIIKTSIERFTQTYGAEAAASISFYAVFSLFPLLLFLVSVVGYLLNVLGAPIQIAEFITDAIPISRNLVYNNLVEILSAKSIGGIIGIVGLMWTGSLVFYTVTRNINRAWPNSTARNMVHNRLVAFLMIFILLLMISIWVLSVAFFNLVPRIVIPFVGEVAIFETLLWRNLSAFIPFITIFIILFGLYRWVPNTYVSLWEAFWPAMIASVGWNLTTRIFTWVLSSGIANFELIYGSLGAAIALILWIYFSCIIIIFGAHLGASIAEIKRLSQNKT
jgi:membrane protein